MGFIDRHLQGSAVNFAGRGVNDALGSVLARGLKHVQGTEHIRLNVGLWRGIGVRYSDQGRQMKDDLVAGYEAANKSSIADIPAHDMDLPSHRLGQIVEPAMAIEGIILCKSSDLGSCRTQRFGQMRAYEAVGSCQRTFAPRYFFVAGFGVMLSARLI